MPIVPYGVLYCRHDSGCYWLDEISPHNGNRLNQTEVAVAIGQSSRHKHGISPMALIRDAMSPLGLAHSSSMPPYDRQHTKS